MNTSQYRFTLDLQSTQSQVCIPVTRGDTARTWLISFRDGSSTYKITDGCLAKLEIMRPTGTHIEEFCAIEKNSTVKYSFSQNKNTAAVEGFHECAVVLYDEEGNILGSPRFSMIVSNRVVSVDTIPLSDENKLIIDSIIPEESARKIAEAERNSAEAQRMQNETARQAAESERAIAEESRVGRFEALQKEVSDAAATLVSPTVTVSPMENGHQVKITDHKGEHMFSLLNGKDGKQGIQGPSGKTAYQYAHEAGYTGTEENYADDMNPDALKNQLNDYLVTELAKRGQLKPEFANSIEECTDTSKLYVLPDGYIYAYMYMEVIAGGYKNIAEPSPVNTTDTNKWINGYRLSSSNIEAKSGKTVSNYISCQNGDVIRIKGITLESNIDRFCVYSTLDGEEKISPNYWNATNNFFSCELVDGVYVVTLKSYQSYVIHDFRFAMTTPTDASAIIVTINEEIKEPVITKKYAWTNTYRAFVPNDYDKDFSEINIKINEISKNIVELKNENTAIGKSIESLETKIENVGMTEIPDYWQVYIESKIATIKSLHKQYGKDCFSFIVLADTHYPTNLGKISPLLARKIMDEADIKYALHCGDWQTRSCHKTKAALLEENEKIESMFAPIRDRLLMQQGNHEGAYGIMDRNGDGEYINKDENGNNLPPAERESYVHNVTPQEMHEFVYRKVGNIGNVYFDDTGTAYYIDDTSNNVRYIGLNTQCNDYELQADGTQKYPKMWIMRFSKSQFDFLINEALMKNVTNKTKIVIFGHVPLTQEIMERELMNGVLRAFKNKTTYSGSCAGEYGYNAISVNADFRNAKGTLIGYFHGHIHSDSLDTSKGFNIIGTRSDAKEEYTEEMRNERMAGTITEQSFNVFTITPNTIYATKIGAGVDREIGY